MQTHHLIPFALMLLGACGGAQPAEDGSQTVQMKDSAVRDMQREREERARERAALDPDEPGQPPEEELAVQMFELVVGQPVRAESGMQVRLVQAGPPWEFQFDHHGRKMAVAVATSPLYAEGIAYGQLYVLSELGSAVQLTLRSDVPNEPLTPNAAFDVARRERAARLGCEGAREETLERDNGTVVLRVLNATGGEACRIVVGRFTGEVVDE